MGGIVEELPTKLARRNGEERLGESVEDAIGKKIENHGIARIRELIVSTSQDLEWKDIIMSFCFISVIAIALQAQQTHSNFPPSLYLLCFAMLLIFSALFVAKFISSKFPTLARALELLAVFVAAAAFFLAVAIPLPLPLKFATWAIFGVSLLTIIICNIFVCFR
ncbi:hypothetical protein I3842_01G173800 [Carya illinoinensis]|uniref:Uncharacterized protein n=1 Tax=Carya illinoinensis TaxID=32201 RepID=A0A922G4J1_CARIL|nr:hypothetical protein I3842_01G173800 [Carya illinoinensis]